MEKNLTNVYYVVWEDKSNAQVVRVSALTEFGAVALAASKCKCYDKSWVRVFTEDKLKQTFGKRQSCRCYSGDVIVNFVEEFNDKVNIGNTQYSDECMEGVSKLLTTLLLRSYEHQSKCVVGSIKGFPNMVIKAAPYDVEYAEPYIE